MKSTFTALSCLALVLVLSVAGTALSVEAQSAPPQAAAPAAADPVLTEQQKIQIIVGLKDLEARNLLFEAASFEHKKAVEQVETRAVKLEQARSDQQKVNEALSQLLQSAQKEGYNLDLNKLVYVKK